MHAFATPIGVNAVGAVQSIDLLQTPHVLVLSTFGYDRTMIMNEMICSIISRTSPAESRFLLIDPLMINFYTYKDLPHLLIEPIHDAKQSVMCIRWVGKEMERRGALLADAGVATVEEYNAKCKRAKRTAMMLPRIVVAIHEVGDVMMTEGIDMSVFLIPLLEKAHLVGIHLVCGTAYFGPKVLRPTMLASFPGVVCCWGHAGGFRAFSVWIFSRRCRIQRRPIFSIRHYPSCCRSEAESFLEC
jgi:S-DNA-T family DNA segregation ATPase FtsK/SpoIIIE